jgi:TRAP-type C4-dicarboxylate transport system permease small subunit
MSKINKVFDKITLYLTYVGAAIVTFVALFVFANVILRSVFKHPLAQTYEVIQFGTLFAVTFVLPRTTLLKSHVRVTFIEDHLPLKLRIGLQSFMNLVCGVIFLYLCYNFVTLAQQAIIDSYVTDIIKMPYVYIYSCMSVCVGVSGLIFLNNIMNAYCGDSDKVTNQTDSDGNQISTN